ncbi:hypothetical protein [Actinokineospora iranica]|uniref:Histidine kinase n=1 Tax=Actinokineospora iranica TaxID=1271860 RepID=A0A1G6IML0_9PSEU|nr:hypothetical protein [Actinokineospora iranica]SDC07670.1 hypothetical protein SAMN05216174_10118 [Actinokineospora iranica]
MNTQSRAEAQFSIALESIQGKRRIERVLEAANALLDRYAEQSESTERLRIVFELVRRNLTDRVAVAYDGLDLGPAGLLDLAESDGESGDVVFHCEIHGPDGKSGTLTAVYREPGSLGLTGGEWLAAMRLLAGISGLGVGGHVQCQR